MSLTIGFIAFFISIVIPGILFRRFFFYGEFSKQFNTKDPVLHSIFFSIIPGIIVQVIGFIIYSTIPNFNPSPLDVFVIFRDITSDGSTGTKEVTENFISNEINTFLIYSFFIFALASVLGWFSSRIIRSASLDKKYKLFRYRNQWYYIFSGEVLTMKKFEDAHDVSYLQNKGDNQDTLMTYADILVSVSDQNDRKELYTGYVVDYDLKSDDISQLDKIYLIDTHRYKKKEKILDDKGVEVKDKVKSSSNENPTKSRNRLKVPGDIFILKATNIVNINLTYLPSLKKEEDKINKKKESKKKWEKRFIYIYNLYFILIIALVLIHFFFSHIGLDKTIFRTYLIQTGFWGKLTVILLINQLLSFAVPNYNEERKLCYDFKNLKLRIFVLLIYIIIAYFLVFKNLID